MGDSHPEMRIAACKSDAPRQSAKVTGRKVQLRPSCSLLSVNNPRPLCYTNRVCLPLRWNNENSSTPSVVPRPMQVYTAFDPLPHNHKILRHINIILKAYQNFGTAPFNQHSRAIIMIPRLSVHLKDGTPYESRPSDQHHQLKCRSCRTRVKGLILIRTPGWYRTRGE